MKTITRPAPHALSDGKELSFDTFVRALINTDSRFNSDGKGIRCAMRIELAMKDSSAETLQLDDEDAKLLADVAEAPTAGYPITPARFCLPFIDAIVKA